MILDDLDRQIAAALIRNGRAPWRQIAEVLGQQERTVARRGNRLLDGGVVRVHALVNPSAVAEQDAFLLRVRARPAALRGVGRWLADRPETLWVSALTGASACVAELFSRPDLLGPLLYQELAAVDGVEDLELVPLLGHHRTASGWHPDVLTEEQYLALRAEEDASRAVQRERADRMVPDATGMALADLLAENGRATLEELSASMSLSTATLARRLDGLVGSGVVFIRAVLDPAVLGYAVEALIEVDGEQHALPALGRRAAGLTTTRWAATTGTSLILQTAVTGMQSLGAVIADLAAVPGAGRIRYSLYAEIFKRSNTVYVDGALPPVRAGGDAAAARRSGAAG